MWIAFVWPFKILSLSLSFFYRGTDCYTNIANKSQTFNPCTRFSKKINTGQSSETHFLQLCYFASACRTAQIGDQWILWNEIFFNKSWSQLTQFSSKLFFFFLLVLVLGPAMKTMILNAIADLAINETDKNSNGKDSIWYFFQTILQPQIIK